LKLGEDKAGEAAGEGKRGDAGDDIATAQRVVVKFTIPFDVGLERDFDTLFAHRVATGFEDLLIEGVEHVYAQIEPVLLDSMSGSEASKSRGRFEKTHLGIEAESGVGGVESTDSSSKNSEVG